MNVDIKRDELVISRKEYAALFSCALAVKTAHEYFDSGRMDFVAKSVLENSYGRLKDVKNI